MKIPTEAEGDDATQVDLTPMIDIVFQLLLFFMVTATFQNDERDLSIEVPEAEHGRTLETLPETLVVGVRSSTRTRCARLSSGPSARTRSSG